MIHLHNKFLSYKQKEERLCLLLTRLETLKAIRDTIDEQEYREEIRMIDFEFKKINHYETLLTLSEDPEVIDDMMFIVDNKVEEASNYYLEKLKEGGFL